MQVLTRPWGALHYRCDGAPGGPVVVFANSLGTDLRLWDALLPHLSPGLRVVRFDTPGHGLSALDPAMTIASVARDVVAVLDHLGIGPAVMVGLSMGGLIAQQIAAARPDRIAALVISNSAARIGTADTWAARIDAVRGQGLASIAGPVLERWFAPAFRATPDLALWRAMLTRTDPAGYIAACTALAAADLTAQTATLRLPTLCIAGALDGSTPPDLVRATAALIPGAAFQVIDGVGHLPCVETPLAYAALLNPFLERHCHV